MYFPISCFRVSRFMLSRLLMFLHCFQRVNAEVKFKPNENNKRIYKDHDHQYHYGANGSVQKIVSPETIDKCGEADRRNNTEEGCYDGSGRNKTPSPRR